MSYPAPNSSPPTLMIVAAGPLQLPAFEEARRAGSKIISIDRSSTAPGMLFAHRAYAIDIKQSEKIIQIARDEKIDGIVSICTDFAVRTVASVAESLGLPGLPVEAARRATDKRLMRRVFKESGVPSPQFAEISDLSSALRSANEIGYPVALKVPRSAGSCGVYRVKTSHDLTECYKQARGLEPLENLLVEQWLNGPEVSVEGCCIGQEPHIVQITDKLLFSGACPVESGHTQPSRLPSTIQDSIRKVTEMGVRALGCENCGFHAELKATSDGPKIIEIAARLGGDRIATHLTPLSTGVNLVKAVIHLSLGRKPDLEPSQSRGAAIRYFRMPGVGSLDRIEGLDELAGLKDLEYLSLETERGEPLKPGLLVTRVQSSLDRCGYVIFKGNSASEAANKAEAAIRSVRFTIRSRGTSSSSVAQSA
jgi:biotin carboxylase